MYLLLPLAESLCKACVKPVLSCAIVYWAWVQIPTTMTPTTTPTNREPYHDTYARTKRMCGGRAHGSGIKYI